MPKQPWEKTIPKTLLSKCSTRFVVMGNQTTKTLGTEHFFPVFTEST